MTTSGDSSRPVPSPSAGAEVPDVTHAGEGDFHGEGTNNRLNQLRAAVLGANDGIVSTAGLVMGVAGAAASQQALLIAGVAGLVAGALSMAGGEYASVSAQRDTEHAMLAKERWELEHLPEHELAELTAIYAGKGLPPELAREVAVALTEHDALAAHAEAELGIDPDDLTSPWAAAWVSALAFAVGALLPLLAIVLLPAEVRVWGTMAAVCAALAVTGYFSARLGGAPPARAMIRIVTIGMLAMTVTWLVGTLVGGQIA